MKVKGYIHFYNNTEIEITDAYHMPPPIENCSYAFLDINNNLWMALHEEISDTNWKTLPYIEYYWYCNGERIYDVKYISITEANNFICF